MDLITDGKLAQKILRRLKESFAAPKDKTCIYCREVGSFKKSEHVIPQALGTFDTRTWTLRDVVCDNCNKFFGDNLEVYFNRGSLEALDRFKFGLKPTDEAKDIHASRVSVVSVSKESEGIKFSPVTHVRLPQVRLLLKGGEDKHESFSLAELEALESIDKTKYDLKNTRGIGIMADEQSDLDRLIAALAKLGIPFVRQGDMPKIGNHRVELEYNVKIDAVILRAVAKVAFNYAAKVRGAAYCRRPDFDAIRKFIRYGERPPFTAVVPSNAPILGYDTETTRQMAGHLLVLESKDRGATIQCRLAFFNGVTYTVTLGRFATVAVQPDIGHNFDFEKKKISPLRQGKKDYRLF
jgi:hypothetical protein